MSKGLSTHLSFGQRQFSTSTTVCLCSNLWPIGSSWESFHSRRPLWWVDFSTIIVVFVDKCSDEHYGVLGVSQVIPYGCSLISGRTAEWQAMGLCSRNRLLRFMRQVWNCLKDFRLGVCFDKCVIKRHLWPIGPSYASWVISKMNSGCSKRHTMLPSKSRNICFSTIGLSSRSWTFIYGFLLRGATPSFYVVAKPRVISIITITSASFLLCQYRRHDPGRHLCVSTSTFFFIPYGMPQLNVVRSRSPVSQECIANCGVPCSVSTGRPPASRPFYHLVTVISITFRRFFFRLPLEG